MLVSQFLCEHRRGNMWTLGVREEYDTRIDVRVGEYNDQVKIHFRHYNYNPKKERWFPTKRGVALNLDEWDKFAESFVAIDGKVRQLRCKNEQTEPVPPESLKRDLQSAFGGDYE